MVIARNGGGTREMFTVRRIVNNEGVERKFPIHSPKIAKIEVTRSAIVRRAKLYYLRDRVGKAGPSYGTPPRHQKIDEKAEPLRTPRARRAIFVPLVTLWFTVLDYGKNR